MKPTELIITTTPYDWMSSTAKASYEDGGVTRKVKATCTSGEEGAAQNLALRVLVGPKAAWRYDQDKIAVAQIGKHKWRATLKGSAPSALCPLPSARSAHTLIELLMVIAIIGILTALAAPSILRTFKAKRTQLLRLERAHNARIEFFSRTETATGELTDPRLRQVFEQRELIYLGGVQ